MMRRVILSSIQLCGVINIVTPLEFITYWRNVLTGVAGVMTSVSISIILVADWCIAGVMVAVKLGACVII